MLKLKGIIGTTLCAAIAASSLTLSAFAADDIVYGTMNIPYDKFYAAEGVGSEVDAVTSATTSKWNNKNLTAGTYGTANEDGTGVILGVTYPVAISRSDLTALGRDNYGFTELKDAPAAYKTVSVNSGKAEFSKVSGNTAAISGAQTSITSDSPWGDYVIDVTSINNANGTSDIGTIYGVVLFTQDGEGYAMRHLQNLWRDEIAWSSGFKTSEPHGNTLDYADYVSLMGKTITEIRYITDSGYHSLEASLYVPVKFNGSVTVSDSTSGSGSANITAENFPADHDKKYSVEGIDMVISDDSISYKNALPGTYTLNVTDNKGVYAAVSTTFTLTTDEMPVKFDGAKLVKANGASDADFENFLKNISTVNVNGKDYAASGRGALAIIGKDGTIDYSVKSGRGDTATAVFNGGEYTISVTSSGYNNKLSFTANSNASTNPDNPNTGAHGAATASGAVIISALAMAVSKKKK